MLDDLKLEIHKNIYTQLKNDVKNGKVYSKNDLTYDLLYTLAVKECIADALIANIFQLTKKQVRSLRKKYHLQNCFVKRMVDFPEFYLNKAKEIGLLDWDLDIYYNSVRVYARSKKWDLQYVEDCIAEKQKSLNYDFYLDNDFHVQVSSNYEIVNKKRLSSSKRRNGQRIDQEKVFYQKRDAGKLGEKIVYDYLTKNLSALGFTEVVWSSNIHNSKETCDGLGYDIVAACNNNKKIYIEVKTSTSIKDYIHFNISSKEVDFMNGNLPNINKEQAFIYYVYNIDFNKFNADILIIDYQTFANFQLIPTQYVIDEDVIPS